MKYKGIILTIFGVLAAVLLAKQPGFHDFITSLSVLGYLGAVLVGVFFVSTFTVATAIVALFYLAQVQNPFLIALAAGFGALLGDLLIFRFVRDTLCEELGSLINKIPYFRKRHLAKLIHNKHLAWFLPALGAMIIASPFPDEIGISLMGIAKVSPARFALISYCLNSFGILALLLIAGY
ncbi:MAG: hypothetical protein Q7S37_00545 [bacterium]|nr:hypothetical protein [bacterium]